MSILNINRGLIGLEDVYTGSNDTFSRLKSDGTSQTITKLTAQAICGRNTFNVKEYGAAGDDTDGSTGTDDTDAFYDCMAAVAAAGGGTVIVPRSTGNYLVSFHIEVPNNTTVVWEGGSYLIRKTGSYNNTRTGYTNRGTVLLVRTSGIYAHGILLINPLIDANNEPATNGIGVGSGVEITAGPNPITKFVERVTVLGGHVQNCQNTNGSGGRGLTAQVGCREIVFMGTHINNCHEALNVSGFAARTMDEWCREVVFSGITARDCGPLIGVNSLGTNADVSAGGSETMHVRFSDIVGRNCGRSNYQFVNDTYPTYAADNGEGVVVFNGGMNVEFDNVSVVNETAYPTIGAFMRGRCHDIYMRDCSFDGKADALFDGKSPPIETTGTTDNHDEYAWKNNVVDGFIQKGTIGYICDSAEFQASSTSTTWNDNNHFLRIVTDTPTSGLMSFDFMRSRRSYVDFTHRDTGVRRAGRVDYLVTRGCAAYTGTITTGGDPSNTLCTGSGVDNTEYAADDIIVIEDSVGGARTPYKITSVSGTDFYIENPSAIVTGYQGTGAVGERFFYVNNDYTTAPAADMVGVISHGFGSLRVVQSHTANRISIKQTGEEHIVIEGPDGELHQFRNGYVPPNMTTATRDALTAVESALIYNTTTNKLNFYNGSAWEAVTSA
jgi:hypothetical protein